MVAGRELDATKKVVLSLSGRPMYTLSDRTLRRYECKWCDQRLDRAKRGDCGSIWHSHECRWPELLALPETTPAETEP